MCQKMQRDSHLPNTPMLHLHPGTRRSGLLHWNSFTKLHFCEKSPLLSSPHPPSLSYPNLLLWVSAHGVLNPFVSNSCCGQGGIERLNESLQLPEGILHVSLPPAHASVFDPLCFPTQLSPSGCKRVPMPTYIQTSLDSMVAAELISVV